MPNYALFTFLLPASLIGELDKTVRDAFGGVMIQTKEKFIGSRGRKLLVLKMKGEGALDILNV